MSNDFREQIQKEAIKLALENNRASFDISVRLGKTYIMLNIAKEYKNVLVSYPSIAILESWKKDADKFGINIEHITFTTNMSLHKHILTEYECVICDEADTLSVNNLEHIQNNLPKHLKLFTGTMPRKGTDKRLIIDQIAPIIYTKLLEETIGHTSKDYQIFVHNLDAKKTILTKKNGTWTEYTKIKWMENKYKLSRVFNDMLMLINCIKNSQTKFEYLKKFINSSNEKLLIFVETKEQCDKLLIPSYYSGNSDSEQNLLDFQNDKINKLVTINQLKASITFNNLSKCIILHSYASNSKAHQKLSRTLTYTEGEKAELHILCIKDTIDVNWVNKALEQFNKDKIKII